MKKNTSALTTPELDSPASYVLATLPEADRAIAEKIISRISAIAEDIAEVGKMLCEMSDKGREELMEAFPAATRDIFRRIHRVGQGQLAPRAVFIRGRAGELISRLPVAEQERVIEERIPVVTVHPSGQKDEFLGDPAVMSTQQLKQVFRSTGEQTAIRTPAEQLAWIDEQARRQAEREKAKPATYIERPDYVVEKGKVFPKPHTCEDGFTVRQLRKMLADLRG